MPESAATKTTSILRDLLESLEIPGAINPALAAHLRLHLRDTLAGAGQP